MSKRKLKVSDLHTGEDKATLTLTFNRPLKAYGILMLVSQRLDTIGDLA